MQRIYISDKGDDENDGLTPLTPIRSWEQWLKLKTGNDESKSPVEGLFLGLGRRGQCSV